MRDTVKITPDEYTTAVNRDVIDNASDETVDQSLLKYKNTKVMLKNGAIMTFQEFHDCYAKLLYYSYDEQTFKAILALYSILTNQSLNESGNTAKALKAPKSQNDAIRLLMKQKETDNSPLDIIKIKTLKQIGFLYANNMCPINLRHVLTTCLMRSETHHPLQPKPIIIKQYGELPALWEHNALYKLSALEKTWNKIDNLLSDDQNRGLLILFLRAASLNNDVLPRATHYDKLILSILSEADLLTVNKSSITHYASLIVKHCIISDHLLRLTQIEDQSVKQMLQ